MKGSHSYLALPGVESQLGFAVVACHRVGIAAALDGEDVAKVGVDLRVAVGARALHKPRPRLSPPLAFHLITAH